MARALARASGRRGLLDRTMVECRVIIFNKLVNSTGIPFQCLQRAVTITGAKDAKAALEKAKREFERLENIPDWKCHAQFVEAEIVAKAKRPVGRSRIRALSPLLRCFGSNLCDGGSEHGGTPACMP